MGADLYIKSLDDKGDRSGYFRDSYNGSNLLNMFGLDYWVWFDSLLRWGRQQADYQVVWSECDRQCRDDEHEHWKKDNDFLTVEGANAVLAELAEREPIFTEHLEAMSQGDREYFDEKYRDFKAFLYRAIGLNEPIYASI